MNPFKHAAGCLCCGDLLKQRFGRRAFFAVAGAAGLAAAMPAPAAAQGNRYEAMLLSCIDPRFPAPTLEWARQRNLVGRYSQFSIAGAAVGVVAPSFEAWHRAFWDNLGASIQLHSITSVVAMNHRDCGAAAIAYGRERVATRELETETHRMALQAFRAQMAARHPNMRVETGLMELDGSVQTFS